MREGRRAVQIVGRAAGALALASGAAYIVHLVGPASLREGAIVAWNLAIIPAALWLGWRLRGERPVVVTLATIAGFVASLLWASSFRRAGLEAWWIGLATAWWLGIGVGLLPARRWLGSFTFALGIAAAADFVLTVLNAPMPIYALGGFKIPMTIVWSIWVGVALVRDPGLTTRRSRPSPDVGRELGQT